MCVSILTSVWRFSQSFCSSSASSERLRQAAATSLSTVYSAGTNVFVGVVIIILATATAALVFTKRRHRVRMRKIEEIR